MFLFGRFREIIVLVYKLLITSKRSFPQGFTVSPFSSPLRAATGLRFLFLRPLRLRVLCSRPFPWAGSPPCGDPFSALGPSQGLFCFFFPLFSFSPVLRQRYCSSLIELRPLCPSRIGFQDFSFYYNAADRLSFGVKRATKDNPVVRCRQRWGSVPFSFFFSCV